MAQQGSCCVFMERPLRLLGYSVPAQANEWTQTETFALITCAVKAAFDNSDNYVLRAVDCCFHDRLWSPQMKPVPMRAQVQDVRINCVDIYAKKHHKAPGTTATLKSMHLYVSWIYICKEKS